MVALKYRLPYILAAITFVSANKLKGVAPDKYDLYQPLKDGNWRCLDGSKDISYTAVNDDYCDCADGSDEPGTSACPNTVFYCANEGHIPTYIKSYQVNDGVCDEACCDGSDEDGGLISCPNRCQEIGEAYRLEQSSLKKSTEAGLAAKNELIQEAEQQIAKWEEQQSKLEDEIILKKSNLLKLQRELNDIESRSSSKKYKKNKKCPSSVIEVATLKHDVVILLKELDTLKSILNDMKRDHNHNFHDMAVKSAISGYDEFVVRYQSIQSEINDNLESINVEEPSVNVEDDDDDEDIEEGDDTEDEGKTNITIVEKMLETVDKLLSNTMFDKYLPLKKPKQSALHGDISSPKAAVENARKLFQEAENDVNQLNSELEKIKHDLSIDYGLEHEWLKLKDVCIEKNEGEYTYSLCFLGDSYQKSNKDSTRTFLGKFRQFTGDSNEDKYKVHQHDQGARCWNGPERSVVAKIECGLSNEILEVTEPEKCEYHFRVLSPAVCQSTATKKHNNNIPIHEEL